MTPNTKSLFRTLLHRCLHRARTIKHRDIKPRDRKKPSLANLNYDVIAMVIDCLFDIDRQSLNSLALVCTALYIGARRVQHRDISIDLDKDNTAVRLDSIVRNGFLPAIRTLRIHLTSCFESSVSNFSPFSASQYFQGYLKAELAAWHQISGLIPMMPGLRDLHWAGVVIPDLILEHLRSNPQVHLHLSLQIQAYSTYDGQHTWLTRLPNTLEGTQRISSLDVKLVYPRSAACRLITQVPLKQLLLSSPRLRTLSLDIAHPRAGCVVRGAEPDYCGFGLANGETLPPLEELTVRGYPWGQQPSVPGWGTNCLGYPEPTGTEMEYWGRNLDWSRLRRLRLYDSSVPLAAHLTPQLTALDEIELSFEYDSDSIDIPAFFSNLPSTLTSISLPSAPTSGLSPLTAHAARLHTLSIHKSPLTNQDLTLLRDALPLLKTLTVVCTRDGGTWPYDTLSILASFPRLESLTIWFPLGPADAPSEPYLTISSASHLFTELRQRGASRLWRLRVHSGFKPKPVLGFLADNAYWRGDNVTSFVCEGHGDDGHAPRVTSCLKLNREQNERLRRVARGKRMKKEEGNYIEFLVALRGPMTMDGYMSWRRESRR